jgi:SAM-dependent methyltransferase
MRTTEFWDDFYAADHRRWSGNANGLLVAEVADLPTGTALDLGCGEGGDAIWLAQRGWQVTAVDVAQAALDAGADHAAEAGVADRIRWERHDLDETFPAGSADLVTACYLHSPVELARDAILRAAAAAVSPGGTLVIIGHAGPPSWTQRGDGAGHDHGHGMAFPSAADVLAGLDLDVGWHVERCADVDQPMRDPDGAPATRPDSVVRVRRRAGA